jgi:hypothetical protein
MHFQLQFISGFYFDDNNITILTSINNLAKVLPVQLLVGVT